jgi:hypothetical protein
MRGIALATAVAAALVVVYLALGGASYAPAKVADPCVQRESRNAKGVEQIVLSALDGAACELHVSREQIVLAFASRDALRRFAREHGISEQRLEDSIKSGLLRSIDDAERAGSLNPVVADLLRGAVRRIPIVELLDLVGRFGSL